MNLNAELLKRLSLLSNARAKKLSEPARKHWNSFVASPLFDEILLLLQNIPKDRSSNQSELHLFAQEAGYQRGYQDCLEHLSLGFPDSVEPETQPESVHSVFSKNKENVLNKLAR